MTTKERILLIRLMGRIQKQPEYADRLGVKVQMVSAREKASSGAASV